MKHLIPSLILVGLSLTALTLLVLEKPVHDLESIKDTQAQFQEYLKKFKIVFKNAEERTYRLRVFLENVKEVTLHNLKSNETYRQGINQFSHLTDEEFEQIYLTLNNRVEETPNIQKFNETSIPSSFDWRQQGAVTPVKNQGGCGSCYAFSSTGALEGLHFINNGTLLSFSEQQIIDCSWKYHNSGCHGGFMDNVFNFVKDNGITTEAQYPYQGKAHLFKCQQKTGEYKISGHFDVQQNDCQGLEQAISQQPVSVAIDARQVKKYTSGIMTSCGDKIKLNHGVLAVGYTSDSFIIKNSWGANWGENGYFRLSKNNTCGVCQAASYPSA